ncbi:MAG: 3'-5' exonuclease [Paludibacter sp.]|nr:3'-5' exonuclease [Paludibacter sp.]
MSKLMFYDCETTGTKFWKNGIHQISGIIEIDGDIKEKFDIRTRPEYKGVIIEEEALAVSGVTREQVLAYPPMHDGYQEILKILGKYMDPYEKKGKKRKFHLVGYNSRGFDDSFLRAYFVQNGDQYFGSWFYSDSIDVMVLASDFFKDVRHQMENFQLRTVCKKAGIMVDETKLHDAQYDISLTRELYYILRPSPPPHDNSQNA